MDEIVEIAVGAMHLMAKDVSSRLKMKQLNCIPIFVQVWVNYLSWGIFYLFICLATSFSSGEYYTCCCRSSL